MFQKWERSQCRSCTNAIQPMKTRQIRNSRRVMTIFTYLPFFTGFSAPSKWKWKRWMISFISGLIVDNNNFRWIRRFEDPATGRPGWNCQRKHCQRHNGSKALSPYTLLSFLSQSTSFKLQLGFVWQRAPKTRNQFDKSM